MIASSAVVSREAHIAESAAIWHGAQIREGAHIAAGCVIGQGAYIGPGVRLEANCRVQNLAQIFEPAHLEEGVFIGPCVVLTNDRFPRAIKGNGTRIGPDDWQKVGVTIHRGASIGAGAVVVAPVVIGAWALVGAGSVVVRSVPANAVVAGNPSRVLGWVCSCGARLASPSPTGQALICETCGQLA